MPSKVFLFIILLFLPFGAVAAPPVGPSFWIGALAAPDSVVLTPGEIEKLNRAVTASVGQMADVASLPDEIPGGQLSGWLSFEPLPGPDAPRFSAGGKPLRQGFFDSLRKNMALDKVLASNPVAFGVVAVRADIRAFPSDRVVIKRPGGFDTFQYSSIAPGEKLALLHGSADGAWGFFQTRFVRGWIRLDRVAFGGRGEGPDGDGGFIVVTGSRETVFGDTALKRPVLTLPMGNVLYLAEGESPVEKGLFYSVMYPVKSRGGLAWKTGYVDMRADVSEGFLPYTRRNIITQAFKMLGDEYGWGGAEGRRDCAAFIMDVFSSAGILLPRHSMQQGASGVVRLGIDGAGAGAASPESMARALAGANPGITLLALDGHIMLYLGAVDGKPHVIHQIWGYMSEAGLTELKKVSVTGLDLGAGSQAGAFKERIRSVSEVTLAPSFIWQTPAEGL